MDKNLHQNAKAPMIALIEKKNIVENKMKRAFVLLLLLGLVMPLAMQAQDFGNPSRAIDECRKPTDLTVSQITTNSAQLSWTENGDATAWYIMLNEDYDHLVYANTNPFTLTELTPETQYIVKVSPYCENEKWSNEIQFTTLDACQVPENLQIDTLTATTATLSWTGFSQGYGVRYRASVYKGGRGTTAGEWQTLSTTEPTITLTGLVPETVYEAQTQSYCDDGETTTSEWSEVFTFTTESEWFAGSGTEDDPYIIATTDDMDALAALVNGGNNCSGTYFLMTDDLDYSGKDYSPIGNYNYGFKGTFNGNGHTISHVIIQSTRNFIGLFGLLESEGSINGLTLGEGSSIKGFNRVGGIVGQSGGAINGCNIVEGVTISADKVLVGGIVGDCVGGNVSNCQNRAAVSSNTYACGGIVGILSSGGEVLQCSNYGSVQALENCGGIVGRIVDCSMVTECINEGSISGNEKVGGIAGFIENQDGNCFCGVSNCLNLGGVSASNSNYLGSISGNMNVGANFNNNYYAGECTIGGINGNDVAGKAMRGYTIEAYAPLSISLEGSIGLVYEGNVYAGNEQGVVVSYEIQNSSLTPQCYTLSAGTLEDNGDSTFTITMPAEDITISGNIVEFYGTYYEIPCNGDTTATVIYDDSYLTLEHVDIEDFEYLGTQYAVTAIADGAFDGCDSIIYFDCHSNISTIGDHAMRNCTGIDYFGFYHTPTPPTLGEGVFEGLSLDTLWLMIPFCSQYDYSTHPVWGQFGTVFPDGECEYNFANLGGDKLWSNPANWAEGEVPGETARVAIFDDCEIDTDVTVGSVTIGYYYDEYYGLYERLTVKDGATLTATDFIYTTGDARNFVIEDGAQVVHPNAGAKATVQKAVSAYSTQSGVNNGWHLIALPLTGSIDVDSVGNMIEGEYDLYAYDESTAYWKNSKNTENSFTALEATKGYLYAHGEDVTLEFSGTLQNSSDTISVPLSYTTVAHLSGFNLVGNPFPCNAYLDREYYVLGENGTDINPEAIPSTVPIPPCTAVFVKAVDEGDSAVFTRVAP